MIGKRILDLRKERKETQEEIGKLIGVGRSTIAQYERGYIKPTIESIKILANHFEVSIDYLTGKTNFRSTKQYEEPVQDLFGILQNVRDALNDSNKIIVFNGKQVTKQTRELLISAVEHVLKIGLILNT